MLQELDVFALEPAASFRILAPQSEGWFHQSDAFAVAAHPSLLVCPHYTLRVHAHHAIHIRAFHSFGSRSACTIT